MSVANKNIDDLQSRLAFQEDMLHGLNERVAAQEKDIDALRIQLQHLYKKMKSLESSWEQENAGDEKLPPHY